MGNCFNKTFNDADFTFINSTFERISMEHDYRSLKQNKPFYDLLNNANFTKSFILSERNSLDSDRPNFWDTPPGQEWKVFSSFMFVSHSEKSYNRNVKNLAFIVKYGWDSFVKNYPLF